MKAGLIRWGLLLSGATMGLLIGITHFFIIEHYRGPFAKDSLALFGSIISALAVFYLVIYVTGFVGYRMMHGYYEAERVRKTGSKQLLLMHVFIVFIAIAGWFIP